MSVKNKLLLLMLVAIAGFALVFAANKIGEHYTSQAITLEETSLHSSLEVLQARRQEKNFVMRRKVEYVGKVGKHIDSVRKSIQSVQAQDPSMASEAAETIKYLDEYQNNFAALAQAEQIVGLTEKDGLRWQFIQAARNMENQFKAMNRQEMVVALLQLRRQEKNFMIRRSDEYFNKTMDNLEVVRELVGGMDVDPDSAQAMGTALDGYSTAFGNYVGQLKKIKEINDSLVRSARAMEPLIKSLRTHYEEQRAVISSRVDYSLMGIEAATVLLMVLFILRTIVSITRPLAALKDYSHEVATGHLDAQPQGEFPAEFGELKTDLEGMVGELRRQLKEVGRKQDEAQEQARLAHEAMEQAQVQENKAKAIWERMVDSAHQAENFAQGLAASSEQLSTMIGQVQQGASVQTERMGETATAMEEMNATVLEVAKNAGRASESSRGVRDQASSGTELVRKAVRAIAQVNSQTENIREGMDELGRQVDAIGRVMEVIGEIADQTNLLALNAAIEAARAGDAGRGFAVVADEVRKLAEKTMQATKEVEVSIQAIQHAAQTNIDRMKEAADAVSASTDLANSSGQAQEEILRLVEENSLQVEGIASAAEQQSAASEEINKAIDEVNRIAEDTFEGMASSVDAVKALAETAGELRKMIEDMLQGASEQESAPV